MTRAPRALTCIAPPRTSSRVLVARRQDDAGRARLDQRDDAVLQLAAGEALGVDVAHLLHLQGRLQRQRIARSAPDDEEVRAIAGWPRRSGR